MLQLLYLGSGEMLRYTPDEADLLATERKVGAIWDAIRRATELGDWRPSPSKLCDWCDHRFIRCTAWPIDPAKVEEDRLWRASRAASVGPDVGANEVPSPYTPPVTRSSRTWRLGDLSDPATMCLVAAANVVRVAAVRSSVSMPLRDHPEM